MAIRDLIAHAIYAAACKRRMELDPKDPMPIWAKAHEDYHVSAYAYADVAIGIFTAWLRKQKKGHK